MTQEHPLKESISKRMADERYVIPKKKKKRKRLDIQLFIIISVLIGLGISILRLIQYFTSMK